MKEAMNATWSENSGDDSASESDEEAFSERIEDQDSDESDCEEHNLEGPKAWVLHDLYETVCILLLQTWENK